MVERKRTFAYGLAVVLAVFMFTGLLLKSRNSQVKEATRSFFAMDTYMTITVYGKDCETAADAAVEMVHQLDEQLSTGLATSEISTINQEKTSIISDDTRILIEQSIKMYDSTNGVFDISIYPIARAWGFTGEEHRVPAQEELEVLLRNVGANRIQLTDNEVTIPKEMEIDLGGIAKGYTAQKITDLFANYTITSAKLDLGGNIQLFGSKPDGSNWKIAIRHPNDETHYLGVVTGSNLAIVTSGGYERFFEENGVIYHHILDTKTGYPAQNGIISATIVCNNGMMADALSTSLYVMGLEKAMDYWREQAGEFDAILMGEDGKIYVTEGLKDSFQSDFAYQIITR